MLPYSPEKQLPRGLLTRRETLLYRETLLDFNGLLAPLSPHRKISASQESLCMHLARSCVALILLLLISGFSMDSGARCPIRAPQCCCGQGQSNACCCSGLAPSHCTCVAKPSAPRSERASQSSADKFAYLCQRNQPHFRKAPATTGARARAMTPSAVSSALACLHLYDLNLPPPALVFALPA